MFKKSGPDRAALFPQALKKSEQMLEEDAIRFDTFLKENDKKAHEAIKRAEKETKLKNDKVQEIKRLNQQIQMVTSDMGKHKEALEDCLKYKEFLDSLTPDERGTRVVWALRCTSQRTAVNHPRRSLLNERVLPRRYFAEQKSVKRERQEGRRQKRILKKKDALEQKRREAYEEALRREEAEMGTSKKKYGASRRRKSVSLTESSARVAPQPPSAAKPPQPVPDDAFDDEPFRRRAGKGIFETRRA